MAKYSRKRSIMCKKLEVKFSTSRVRVFPAEFDTELHCSTLPILYMKRPVQEVICEWALKTGLQPLKNILRGHSLNHHDLLACGLSSYNWQLPWSCSQQPTHEFKKLFTSLIMTDAVDNLDTNIVSGDLDQTSILCAVIHLHIFANSQ